MVTVTIKEKPPRDKRPVGPAGSDVIPQRPTWYDRSKDSVMSASDWIAEKTGARNFFNNLDNFYDARNQYSKDKGLGFLEENWKNPYTKDQYRWAGNVGYNIAEGMGDLFELGWRIPPAAAGYDTIPGDEGVLGSYWANKEFDPTWNLFGFDLPNPFRDDLKIGKLEQAIPELERELGFLTGAENENPLDILNFQNHLRNYNLDLSDLNATERVAAFENWMGDQFLGQYDQTINPDAKYDIIKNQNAWRQIGDKYLPREYLEGLNYYDPYLNLNQKMINKILGDYNKSYLDFQKTTMLPILESYDKNLINQRNQELMDEFGFKDEAELVYAMSKGNVHPMDALYLAEKGLELPEHMGLFNDLLTESTMPFIEDDFRFDYETDEANKLAAENPFWSEGVASLLGWGQAVKGFSLPSKIKGKPGILRSSYYNMYPGLSKTGGTGIPVFNFPTRTFTGQSLNIPSRGWWQTPALTYAAAAQETGDE